MGLESGEWDFLNGTERPPGLADILLQQRQDMVKRQG